MCVHVSVQCMCVLEYTVQRMEASINELYKSLALHALTHIHTYAYCTRMYTHTPHTHSYTSTHMHISTHTHMPHDHHDHRAAAMTLRTVLLSIQALLTAAEPTDPQDAVVAKQYMENIDLYKKTARHWAIAYAGGGTGN